MKIINCGSLNLDYVYSVDHMVQKGETLSSISMETFCGGKGLNQSIALCKSGISVYHAGRVGRTNGDMLLKMLEDVGVNTDFVSMWKRKQVMPSFRGIWRVTTASYYMEEQI